MKKLIFILLISTICTAQIPKDKQLHFGVGLAISTITNVTIYSVKKDRKKAFWVGVGMSILAGVGKEIYDKKQGKKFDVADIGYTVAGGVISSLTINLFNKNGKYKR